MMYCYFCGKENSEDQKYCKYCGKSLHPMRDNNEKQEASTVKKEAAPDQDVKGVEEEQVSVAKDAEETRPPIAKDFEETQASFFEDPEEIQTQINSNIEKEPGIVSEGSLKKDIKKGPKSSINGLLISVIIILSLLIVGVGAYMFFALKGNNDKKIDAEVSKQEPAEISENRTEETIEIEEDNEGPDAEPDAAAEPPEEKEDPVEETLDAKETFRQFLDNEIPASVFDEEMLFSDIQKEYDTEGYEYRDVDNDGEDEMLIHSEMYFYPVMVLDAVDGDIRYLCSGDGTAQYLTFYNHEGTTLACYSDTTHQGRQSYNFVQYKGPDIVDEFTLSAEYWDNPKDWYDKNSVFTYRNKEITMEEYEALLKDYTGIESQGLETDSSEITIESTSLEDYSKVSYRMYRSELGSENFNFIYPENLYKSVSHDYGIQIEEPYGTLIERVIFTGGGGSSLEYKMYRRSPAYSKEDILNAVYLGELQNMLVIPGADPNIRAPRVDKGYGLAVISGWAQDAKYVVYEVIEVEDDYILLMRMVAPDISVAKTVTSDLYNGCGFSASKLLE
ncbi:MAG: zinc ribbon domain-containing protein [Lachnospiraceae bacterium]|nr:zinc ribbon domain-containing protein [Lachnospiraceae bacterium]